ncbi:MAG: GGDEF domain-containing protein, partial [Treponema sp.]|nr:GGDEF domain-containing protein [Treponema sp.]
SSRDAPLIFVGLFIDIDENKKNELDLFEQFNIVNALSRDYANIISIRITTRTIKPIKLSGYIPDSFKNNDSLDSTYESFFTEYIEQRVYSEDRAFMEKAIALSETDQMTTLLNRVSSEKKVTEHLKNGDGGFLILLDVDHFKSINDTLGHGIGDQVIINVANCLRTAFREHEKLQLRKL